MFEGLSKLVKGCEEKDMSVGAADALASMNGLTDQAPAARPAVEGAQDLDNYIVGIPCPTCGAVSNVWGPRFQEFAANGDSFPCPACNMMLRLADYASGLDSLKQALPEVTQVVQATDKPLEEIVLNRLQKGINGYPSKDEIDHNQRTMAAKSMEDEAQIRQIYGDPQTREQEKGVVLREWERIKHDQDSGLPDEDVWKNHLDRMQQIARACNNPRRAAIRAAHFELEGLTTAAGILRDQVEALSGNVNMTKGLKDIARLALGGTWLRKANEPESEDTGDIDQEELDELMDQFILDMLDAGLDMDEIEYYSYLVAATMQKSKGGNGLEKSWKWQRKDGSWWMTDPEGGKPIPYREGDTFSHFAEGAKAQHAKNVAEGKVKAIDPAESYGKLPEEAQQRVQAIMAQFAKGKKGIESILEKAHARIQRVNYLKVGRFPPEILNNPAFKAQNEQVAALAHIGKAYLSRALRDDVTPTQKQFWAAIAHVMSEDAMRESKKRNLINKPFFTAGEGAAPDIRSGIDVFVGHQAAKWREKDIKAGFSEEKVKAKMIERAQHIADQMNNPMKALSRSQQYEALGFHDQANMFYALHQELMAMTPAQRKERYLKYLGKSKAQRDALKAAIQARKLERQKKKGVKAEAKPAKKNENAPKVSPEAAPAKKPEAPKADNKEDAPKEDAPEAAKAVPVKARGEAIDMAKAHNDSVPVNPNKKQTLKFVNDKHGGGNTVVEGPGYKLSNNLYIRDMGDRMALVHAGSMKSFGLRNADSLDQLKTLAKHLESSYPDAIAGDEKAIYSVPDLGSKLADFYSTGKWPEAAKAESKKSEAPKAEAPKASAPKEPKKDEAGKEDKAPKAEKAPKAPKAEGGKKGADGVNVQALNSLFNGKDKYESYDESGLEAIRQLAMQKKNVLPAGAPQAIIEDVAAELKKRNKAKK